MAKPVGPSSPARCGGDAGCDRSCGKGLVSGQNIVTTPPNFRDASDHVRGMAGLKAKCILHAQRDPALMSMDPRVASENFTAEWLLAAIVSITGRLVAPVRAVPRRTGDRAMLPGTLLLDGSVNVRTARSVVPWRNPATPWVAR